MRGRREIAGNVFGFGVVRRTSRAFMTFLSDARRIGRRRWNRTSGLLNDCTSSDVFQRPKDLVQGFSEPQHMVLIRVFPALVGAVLLMLGGAAIAADYRADEFLSLDLSKAVLSPKPLGPPAEFAPVPLEAKGDVAKYDAKGDAKSDAAKIDAAKGDAVKPGAPKRDVATSEPPPTRSERRAVLHRARCGRACPSREAARRGANEACSSAGQSARCAGTRYPHPDPSHPDPSRADLALQFRRHLRLEAMSAIARPRLFASLP